MDVGKKYLPRLDPIHDIYFLWISPGEDQNKLQVWQNESMHVNIIFLNNICNETNLYKLLEGTLFIMTIFKRFWSILPVGLRSKFAKTQAFFKTKRKIINHFIKMFSIVFSVSLFRLRKILHYLIFVGVPSESDSLITSPAFSICRAEKKSRYSTPAISFSSTH